MLTAWLRLRAIIFFRRRSWPKNEKNNITWSNRRPVDADFSAQKRDREKRSSAPYWGGLELSPDYHNSSVAA